MNIAIFGAGYVGLVAAACLSNLGNTVVCVDVDAKRVAMLRGGRMPIYEPGLAELVALNMRERRLSFTTEAAKAVRASDVIFIAVGTPQGDDGRAHLGYVHDVARTIGRAMDAPKVVVDKSTVPVGTADEVRGIIKAELKRRKKAYAIDMVSNPEFLREGIAIRDFMVPDRIVVGADSARARKAMLDLYRPIERTGHPLLVTDIKSAELIKYASNAMLATRISFMNALADLAERIGADIKLVAKGVGYDTRIGPRFLQAGIGYGGSCFPKDVQALIHTMKSQGVDAGILEAVERTNAVQKLRMVEKMRKGMGVLKGRRIAVWGLAFKPKTDDMREAPSIAIIAELLRLGAEVVAFDPVAQASAKRVPALKGIAYAKDPYEALAGADALVVCTEWDEFRTPDFARMRKAMRGKRIFDGRNIYEPQDVRAAGFTYVGVGR